MSQGFGATFEDVWIVYQNNGFGPDEFLVEEPSCVRDEDGDDGAGEPEATTEVQGLETKAAKMAAKRAMTTEAEAPTRIVTRAVRATCATSRLHSG